MAALEELKVGSLVEGLVPGVAVTVVSVQTPRPPVPPRAKQTTRFYGSVKLNPLKLASSAGQIGDEIVRHLAGLVDADVEVVLEVRAHVRSGIPDTVQRTVGENAKTLKFQTFEFEEE